MKFHLIILHHDGRDNPYRSRPNIESEELAIQEAREIYIGNRGKVVIYIVPAKYCRELIFTTELVDNIELKKEFKYDYERGKRE